ncbi:MAG TPA: 6-hydroxymethylpterin diphosphokinase MptE-like protein [Methanomicrobiales archaeon]|nr:6-hydroxymethylpterin diphosphokinase MptE-like protein [Methanomicrobiales archaeon]
MKSRKNGLIFAGFEDWEPYYLRILEHFHFDRARDEEAALLLASLLARDDLPVADALIRGKTATVCGNGPNLTDELDRIRGTVIAADGAANRLFARGIPPGVIVTDLDGATDAFIRMNVAGTVIVVHAHGDNMPLLRSWVPRFPGPLVGTTQSRPFGRIHNFGGFSDGDRAVFLAHALGASEVAIAGFNLDDPNVDPVKREKLLFARELLGLAGHDL